MRSGGLILFGLSFAACALAAKIDGIWELTITQFGDPEVHRTTIETNGEKLTGQYGDIKLEGTVHGDAIQFQARYLDGHGHAAQGDGELTGNALETSMDVEFSVDVVRDKSSRMPRVENSDFIMALGIAGSAGEALQIATTELARWLERDYKVNANEVALVLGSSVRYEIAELVDPQVNISAKVAKSVLAQLRQ